MRTEAYVNRLILATKQENPDVRKIARMLELTLDKVSETAAGDEALKLVQARMFKDTLRKMTGVRSERSEAREIMDRVPVKATPELKTKPKFVPIKKPSLPIEEKRRFRHFRIEN